MVCNIPFRDDWERLNAADYFAQALLVCKGHHKRTLSLFEEFLTSRTINGYDDINPLTLVRKLAFLYQKIRNLDLALPLFGNVLEAQRCMLGNDALDTMFVVKNLVVLLLHKEHIHIIYRW